MVASGAARLVPDPGRRNGLLLLGVALAGNMCFDRALWIIYLQERGFSLLQVGLLESLLHITIMIFEVPTGVLADLFGRKASIIIGHALWTLYLVGMVFAGNIIVAALSFFCLGLSLSFISGAEVALLYDSQKALHTEKGFTRTVGLYYGVMTVGMAAAMAAGGLVRQVSWPLVFLLGALAQLTAVALSCLLTEVPVHAEATRAEPRRSEPLQARLTPHLKGVLAFLKESRAARALLAGTALFAAATSTYHLYAQSLLSGAGFTLVAVGGLFGLESLLSAGASAQAHAVEAKLTPRRALLGVLAGTALLFPLVAVNRRGPAAAAFFLVSPAANLFAPIAESAINREIPSALRATLLSAMSMTCSLFMALLFPAVGYAADRFGLNGPLALAGVAASLACLGCAWYFFRARAARATVKGAGVDAGPYELG